MKDLLDPNRSFCISKFQVRATKTFAKHTDIQVKHQFYFK